MGDDAKTTTPKSGRYGRSFSIAGLVGLGIAAFLPQGSGCGETPIVPAQDFFSGLWLFFFPFCFAFGMLAVYLVRRLLRSDRARNALTHAAAAVALATLLVDDWLWAQVLNDSSDWQEGVSVAAAGLGTLAVGWIWLRAPSRLRTPLVVLTAGFVSFLYFLCFATGGGGLWGLWVSLASSFVAALGGLVESLALRKQPAEIPLEVPRGPR